MQDKDLYGNVTQGYEMGVGTGKRLRVPFLPHIFLNLR